MPFSTQRLLDYMQLMRFHKPIGIILLLLPTAWALWVANQGTPALSLILIFFLGTICMRALGCVINDLADRDIDKHVTRTKQRPITNAVIRVPEALVVCLLLLSMAFYLVMLLPIQCFYEALIALGITIFYPFCKRFFQAPQLILGVAFSMGMLMAYTASGVSFNSMLGLLFAINTAWIITYDTMYAMADRDDDRRIGVKSTAILFGRHDKQIIALLQLFFHSAWLLFLYSFSNSLLFLIFWSLSGIVLIYQHYLLQKNTPTAFIQAFTSNAWYGLLMWLGILCLYHIDNFRILH